MTARESGMIPNWMIHETKLEIASLVTIIKARNITVIALISLITFFGYNHPFGHRSTENNV